MTVISPHRALEYFETKLEFMIDPLPLKDAIEKGEVNVIDVRDEKEFRKGHIPTAINLPKDRWHSFEGLTHDKPNVVYCYSLSCMLSARACREFAQNDYPVMELIGGFDEWKAKNLPTER